MPIKLRFETEAELSGAKGVLQSMEKQLGAAKAAGEANGELTDRVNELRQAVSEATAEFARLEQAKKSALVDDWRKSIQEPKITISGSEEDHAERQAKAAAAATTAVQALNVSLERNTGLATDAAASINHTAEKTQAYVIASREEYVAIEAKARALMKEIALRKAQGLSVTEQRASLKLLDAALSTDRAITFREEVEALAAAKAKAKEKTEDWRHSLTGLQRATHGLSWVRDALHMILHPITAITIGLGILTHAWGEWQKKLQEKNALAQTANHLEDLNLSLRNMDSALAGAQDNIAETFEKARENADRSSSAYESAVRKVKAWADAEKELVKVLTETAIKQVEIDKIRGRITSADADRQKAALEGKSEEEIDAITQKARAKQVQLARDEAARQDKLAKEFEERAKGEAEWANSLKRETDKGGGVAGPAEEAQKRYEALRNDYGAGDKGKYGSVEGMREEIARLQTKAAKSPQYPSAGAEFGDSRTDYLAKMEKLQKQLAAVEQAAAIAARLEERLEAYKREEAAARQRQQELTGKGQAAISAAAEKRRVAQNMLDEGAAEAEWKDRLRGAKEGLRNKASELKSAERDSKSADSAIREWGQYQNQLDSLEEQRRKALESNSPDAWKQRQDIEKKIQQLIEKYEGGNNILFGSSLEALDEIVATVGSAMESAAQFGERIEAIRTEVAVLRDRVNGGGF